MTTATTSTSTTERRSLAAALLARRGTVHLPAQHNRPTAGVLAGVALLDADLLDRGYLMSAELRQALTALDARTLATRGRALLTDIDRALGSDRTHVPLFRDFPESTPQDTYTFYVDRVLTLLFQAPEQPCVLCGTDGTVHAVSPCAHLVCRTCFDGSDFSACPVCHRRIDADDPFLRPQRPRQEAARGRALPDRLRVLGHGGDLTARTEDAGHELEALLARPTALSPQDTDDLVVFLDTRDRGVLSWLPEIIPGRETKARTLAWLLADPAAYDTTLPAAAALVDTATDVLRLLAVRSGGDAGLTDIPRFAAVPRPLRRALLSVLDGLDPALVAEDMGRHARAWKHAGERLHPFEYAVRHPNTALAFAALREFRLGGDALSARLRATAEQVPAVTTDGKKVSVTSWAAKVEDALARADIPGALALLAQRPGELVRRLDHLLRTADGENTGLVLSALESVTSKAAPAVLLSALGAIRTRGRTGDREAAERVFFPKGGRARAHIVADERDPLPADVVARAEAALTGEILRRAGELGRVPLAVVDSALDGVVAPFAARTASRSLVTLPRGSELALPDGRTIRLFLHWMESDTSGITDLDLSTAMFDADWTHIGTCDYTQLRFARDAAVHSGDLTSAPAPSGASEFVDLDPDKLAAAGVRYVVTTVYSFDGVAFGALDEAFAGLMVREAPGTTGPAFDPRQVEQRFDLTGQSRALVPMVIDVAARTMRWLDIVQGVTGTHHAVHRYADDLATLGQGLTSLFTSGARVSLGELATWQAAARADTVIVRHAHGAHSTYRRRTEETAHAFALRIGTPATDGPPEPAPDRATLAYLLRGDLDLPARSEVFALHPAGLAASNVRLLTASDLAGSLA